MKSLVLGLIVVAVLDTVFIANVWQRYRSKNRIPWLHWIGIVIGIRLLVLVDDQNYCYRALSFGLCMAASSSSFLPSRLPLVSKVVKMLWTFTLVCLTSFVMHFIPDEVTTIRDTLATLWSVTTFFTMRP